MPETKLVRIPEYIKNYYQKLGVTKLPDFIKPNFVVPILNMPYWTVLPIRRVEIPDTLGNAEFEISPGVGKRLKLRKVFVKVVADANPANREMKIALEDENDNPLGEKWGVGAAITAGQTRYMMLCEENVNLKGGGWEWTIVIAVGDQVLDGTDKLVFTLQAGLAGDVFSGRASFWEVDTN